MGSQVIEGEFRVRRHEDGRVEVLQAPQRSTCTLEVLAERDPVVLKVRGREIRIANQVAYRVVGWDDVQSCLVIERIPGGV